MAGPMYFQWQNEILCKDIYPMRLPKLRDFLVYSKEIDLWKEYKNKTDLARDIQEYVAAQKQAAVSAYQTYSSKREYFFQPDARVHYSSFKPIDEAELAAINQLHGSFIRSWPKSGSGERNFIELQIRSWKDRVKRISDQIKSRKARQAAMDPNHPKYVPERQELQLWENATLPLANRELAQLEELLDAFTVIEKRKLEWARLQQFGRTPAGMTEAEFLVQFVPKQTPNNRDIAIWKAQVYEDGLKSKNQYELLEEIRQRFVKEPKRYPYWLQYMVVHFSGMRYDIAHGSWADPRDLLARLRAPKIEEEIKKLDDATVVKQCQEIIALYEGPSTAPKPGLAGTTDKQWRTKIGWYMPSVKSNGLSFRRQGLTNMRKLEYEYEIKSKPTQEALDTLRSMKTQFPAWAWKMIVRLTPLRVTEVTADGWEELSPAERQESFSHSLWPIISAWSTANITGWREEHGRSHELIVTRAVCNETAEHVQHMRGHLPPGGLADRPKWYRSNADEKKISGTPGPYFVKATSAEQYTPGASVLWLRFVDKQPDRWQIAKRIETSDKVGLLPEKLAMNGIGKDKPGWTYRVGEVITRERFLAGEGKGVQKARKGPKQVQWLRWLHEATVAEVGETAEGTVVITFETSLPDDDKGTSSLGIFKKPLRYFLADYYIDGNEDTYNRSFVGYVPEGPVPMEHINRMLDWNKIFRK